VRSTDLTAKQIACRRPLHAAAANFLSVEDVALSPRVPLSKAWLAASEGTKAVSCRYSLHLSQGAGCKKHHHQIKQREVVMNIKVITAASAIVLGLAFAGPSFAETMLGGVAVADSDLPKVQEKCDALAQPESLSTPGQTTDQPAASDSDGQKANDANAMATGAPTAINIDAITLDQCKEAGLVK